MGETSPMACRFGALAGSTATVIAVTFGAAAFDEPVSVVSIKCPAGEVEDVFTGVCLPEMSPSVIQMTTQEFGGPPEIDGVPCSGQNSYECIGLAEEQNAEGPTPIAKPSWTSSP